MFIKRMENCILLNSVRNESEMGNNDDDWKKNAKVNELLIF